MRALVLMLCILQTVLIAGIAYGGMTVDSDPAGNAMAQGFATLAAIAFVGFTLPAATLAWFDKLVPLALLLSLVVPVGFVLLFGLPL